MNLSPTRKMLNILFATLVLAFFGVVFWPSITSPIRLWLYCAKISAGENALTAIDQAKEQGFQVAPPTSNVSRVYDIASLGRVGCLISTNDAGVAVGAKMELSD